MSDEIKPAQCTVKCRVLVEGVIHSKCQVRFSVAVPMFEGMTEGWAKREALTRVLKEVEQSNTVAQNEILEEQQDDE